MGKPYQQELQKLESTCYWVNETPVEELVSFVEQASQQSLITIGSGGSLTAAAFATSLHEDLGQIAVRYTPLEFVRASRFVTDVSILLLTAGGRNPDILHAFRHAAECEASQVLAICTRSGSPIRHLSDSYEYTKVCEFDLPSGKDGFLATNSLVATIGLLSRAYQIVSNPAASPVLKLPVTEWLSCDRELNEQLLGSEQLIVLHGGWSSPAAVDLESKLHEAGISSVQLADYRNFAHGRHYWLARHADTCVIALATSDEIEIAKSTLRVLPKAFNTTLVSTPAAGPVAGLELIVRGLNIVGLMAHARNQDPGKPRVPAYGRQIYHLETLKDYAPTAALNSLKTVAIRRKLQHLGRYSGQMVSDCEASVAFDEFVDRIQETSYGAIVCDYDGTLCSQKDRYTGISVSVSNELNRLLASGTIIGIATGRGKSVREALQKSIAQSHWSKVLVGYYNGGVSGLLNQDELPPSDDLVGPELQEILDELRKARLDSHAKLTLRIPQITIEPNSKRDWTQVRAAILECITRVRNPVKLVESSHSIDILGHGVSKLTLVGNCQQLCKDLGLIPNALCIGDRGRWPGNDCELLSLKYSLSVDTVSSDLHSCWNLAPAGMRGVQATVHYLESLQSVKNALRLQLPRCKGSKRCATR